MLSLSSEVRIRSTMAMNKKLERREFLRKTSILGAGMMVLGTSALGKNNLLPMEQGTGLKISLAEWSFHKALYAHNFSNLDFATKARSLDIGAIEYVSRFFEGNEKKMSYLKELNNRAKNNGVEQLLIMVDDEGELGASEEGLRLNAVENHKKWIEAAKTLGCHSIRVNAAGSGTREEVHAYAVEGLGRLAEVAKPYGINVIVENHGGWSSDGSWLSSVINQVAMSNCGTLPDFGNFCIKYAKKGCDEEYDRYKGVTELMPFAKAVSAKSNDFDDNGQEVNIDYKRMIDIVVAAGYKGYVGIEYEGTAMSEEDGVKATKRLLEKYI